MDWRSLLKPSARDRYRQIATEGAQIIESAWSTGRMNSLEAALRAHFSLFAHWDEKSGGLEADLAAMPQTPGLASVFLHHGDGRVRQGALEASGGPLGAPSELMALATRLNDWVPQVRNSAIDAARRRLPQTPAATMVPALVEVLPFLDSWRRWTGQGKQVVLDLLSREDVADLLARHIVTTGRARTGAVFRQFCRSPLIDPLLEAMAAEARMPNVRAMALDCVLTGKALIPTGDRQVVWVDKSFGAFHLQKRWITRQLTVRPDKAVCLDRCSMDRSPTVRRRVAQGLVDLMSDPASRGLIGRLARALESDRDNGVRERIAFIRKQGLT